MRLGTGPPGGGHLIELQRRGDHAGGEEQGRPGGRHRAVPASDEGAALRPVKPKTASRFGATLVIMSNEHTDDGLAFALQVTGFELATEPPAPDTPLARILRLADEIGYENLTDEHFDMAKLGLL